MAARGIGVGRGTGVAPADSEIEMTLPSQSGELGALLGAVLGVVEGPGSCVLHQLRVVVDRVAEGVDERGTAAGAVDGASVCDAVSSRRILTEIELWPDTEMMAGLLRACAELALQVAAFVVWQLSAFVSSVRSRPGASITAWSVRWSGSIAGG